MFELLLFFDVVGISRVARNVPHVATFHPESEEECRHLGRAAIEAGWFLDHVLGFRDGDGRMFFEIRGQQIRIRGELIGFACLAHLLYALDTTGLVLFEIRDQGGFRFDTCEAVRHEKVHS